MTRVLVGIGDLHLDGKLTQYVPNLNDVIEDEVRTVLRSAVKQGATTAILYGDLCERSVMSYEAIAVLSRLFVEFNGLDILVIKGNHDASDTSSCSLDLLAEQCRLGLFPNVTVARNEPCVVYGDTDYPVNLLPWPLKDTRGDMLNVLHVEAAGAKWETGRPVDSGLETKHLCVIGHIHTAQKVRNSHYSGTLYQTSFGEDQRKFYHVIQQHASVRDTRVHLKAHQPRLLLKNHVISSRSDYDALRADCESDVPDTRVLRKVFFKAKDLLLDPDAFADLSSVVKTQGFTSGAELSAMLLEDLVLDDASHAARWDLLGSLKRWLVDANVDDDLRVRAYKKARELAERAPTTPQQDTQE